MLAVTQNETTTTVVTEHGRADIPNGLYELFASCEEPVKLTDLIAAAKDAGFSNGYVRGKVQVLAQPGQYSGSPCIGALHTSTEGRSLFVQWGVVGEARAKLTRKNGLEEDALREGA